MSTNNTCDTPPNSTDEAQEGGGDSNPTDKNQQRATRPNTRRSTRGKDVSNQNTKTFKRETSKMSGHVFQTLAEKKENRNLRTRWKP